MYSSRSHSERSVLLRSLIPRWHNRCAAKITLSKEIRYLYRQLHQNHKKTNTIITIIRAVVHTVIHIVVAIQAIKIMIHTIRYGIKFISLDLLLICFWSNVFCYLLPYEMKKKHKTKQKSILLQFKQRN